MRYARALGTYELLDYLEKSVIQISPSQGEIDACAAFFQESELSDIVHVATCLYTDAVLISNDHHFDKIKEAGIIEVWSSSKAIRRLLHGIEDFEDS